MFSRVFFLTVLGTLFATAFALAQTAPTSTGSGLVLVSVTDAQSGAPIEYANVFLIGGTEPISTVSDVRGEVTFNQVPTGIYRIQVDAHGYDRTDVTEFEVLRDDIVALDVKLALSHRTIAAVTAHASTISVNSIRLGADDPLRRVSPTLLDALNKVAGVHVDSEGRVSLNGFDPSHVGISINGISVGGAATGLSGAMQDLFSGADVNLDPSGGGAGGDINYWTIQPTKTWAFDSKDQIGNYTSAYAASATGTIGQIGVAFARAFRGNIDPLDGRWFTDQSGVRFLHDGNDASTAYLGNIRLSLNKKTTMTIADVHSDQRGTQICSTWLTAFSCGTGPSPLSVNRSDNPNVSVQSIIGNMAFRAQGGGWQSQWISQLGTRAVGALRQSFASKGTYSTYYGNVSLSSTTRKHTVGMHYGFFTSGSTSERTIDNITMRSSGFPNNRQNFSLSDSVKMNSKFRYSASLGTTAQTNTPVQLSVSMNVGWQPSRFTSFGLGAGAGSQNWWGSIGNAMLSDPLDAQFDCTNRSTQVSGPGDPPSPKSSHTVTASFRHSWRHGENNVSAWFSSNSTHGGSQWLAVPLSTLPAADFPNANPAAYYAALKNVWQQTTVCGATPFDPNRIWIGELISNLDIERRSLNVSGQLTLGRNVRLLPSFNVQSVYLKTLDARLSAKGSYYRAGQQLPNWPLHEAGLTLDVASPRTRTEWLFNAQYEGAAGWNNLPAYTVLNAGVLFHPKVGTMTLTIANLFGSHVGYFTTSQGYNPMPLVGGGYFVNPTTPLPPRRWAFTYDIPWSQHVSPPPQPKSSVKIKTVPG